MQNSPKKVEVPCPICLQKYIPEAFHKEKVIIDTIDDSSRTHIITERNAVNKFTIII